jgi:cob(I)alamin adenosyltransferase
MAPPDTNWSRGHIQLYTGDGKGKTTMALGLALRAAGHGLRTYIGQFMKALPSGERQAAARLGGLVTIETYGSGHWQTRPDQPDPAEVARARDGLARARQAMLSGRYRIVVLDEVNVAIFFHLLTVEEVLAFLRAKPEAVELVLTGRRAPQELIDAADLVSEVHSVKHYSDRGVEARDGIEK